MTDSEKSRPRPEPNPDLGTHGFGPWRSLGPSVRIDGGVFESVLDADGNPTSEHRMTGYKSITIADCTFVAGPGVRVEVMPDLLRAASILKVESSPSSPTVGELEVVAWRWNNEPHGEEVLSGKNDVRPASAEPLVTLSSAQSSIQRAERERDRFRDMADGYGKLDADYAIAQRRATAAEAQLEEAGKVLEPFASESAEIAEGVPRDTHFIMDGFNHLGLTDVTVADFRAARAFLASLGEKQE